ncbi:MAG: hypothetical protein OXI53_07840 [Nitrospira sp.]|nr:hypothetical protein [Nitrospira sp.]MDE0485831.1 hypothetical protein [Nitrospira sp.]
MFKIKKRPLKPAKEPQLYNVLENYTDFDPPGNVMVCAMAGEENIEHHAKVLGESYEIPLDDVRRLLTDGGLYTYPETGGVVTRGMFVCRIDPTGPKQTWVLDLEQTAQAEQLAKFSDIPLAEAVERVFYRGLPGELQERLTQKNLGLDYSKLERSVARGGDIRYIDFRKDWSPYFKRKCSMPDGSMVETGGIGEFAELHGITVAQAQTLMEQGGTLELEDGVLACQVVNNQPTVARFNAKQYAKAKELMESQGLHVMDALSEMALNDPVLMRALRRAERENSG